MSEIDGHTYWHEDAFVSCPICGETSTREDGHVYACDHLEVLWCNNVDQQGGIGFCGDDPEYSHYITYSIVQLNHALIMLRGATWSDATPAESGADADRLDRALRVLKLASATEAPAWCNAFKADGAADDWEFRECFSELFWQVCHDYYGDRMTHECFSGTVWFALWSTDTTRPDAEPDERLSRWPHGRCYHSESKEWECMSAQLDAYAKLVRDIIVRTCGPQDWDAVDDILFANL